MWINPVLDITFYNSIDLNPIKMYIFQKSFQKFANINYFPNNNVNTAFPVTFFRKGILIKILTSLLILVSPTIKILSESKLKNVILQRRGPNFDLEKLSRLFRGSLLCLIWKTLPGINCQSEYFDPGFSATFTSPQKWTQGTERKRESTSGITEQIT